MNELRSFPPQTEATRKPTPPKLAPTYIHVLAKVKSGPQRLRPKPERGFLGGPAVALVVALR